MAAEEKWYFAKKQLENSPSRKCDIDSDKELSYRQQAANFIQDVGQRLQVSQLCINTAIVYMHRFYVFHSFTQFHRYSMASAALFLAAKVEEQPRKLEHVIKVAHLCLHKEAESTTPATPDVKSEQYAQAAHELVFNENVLLQTLGFDVAIDHPHTHVVRCCHLVKASKDLAQTSYFLASNSLHLTTMCLQYKPTVVACFCIHLACKWSNWEIPPSSEGKPWFTYVDESVTTEMLDELTKEFISIYNKCPSRLKKKIQSMSASLGQSSGNQSSSSQSGGSSSNSQPVNCNSPMTADNKKLQSQHKDQNYHSKVHHSQMKPGIVHPHRPPHDPNINYNEYKEKKERERQSMGAPSGSSSHNSSSMPGPHHKQLPPSSSSSNSVSQSHKHGGMPPSNTSSLPVPPQNRNQIHHRSSNSNVDPKLKMHQQMHPQHSNRSGNQSSSSHPRMLPMDQLHRDQNQHIRNSTNDSSSNRDHYRLQQINRDITAPREPPQPATSSSSLSGSSAPSSSIPPSSNISSERELMKEQQMRERHQAGGNALHFIDNLPKDSLLREVMDRSTSQSANNRPEKHRPDLFKDLFKDSNTSVNNSDISDKQKYELNKKLSGTNTMVVNNIKHDSSTSSRHNRSSSSNESSVKSSHSSKQPPLQQPPPMYNNDQNKNKSTTSLNIDKNQQKYPPGGNSGTNPTMQQQRPKQPPYTSNTSIQSTDSKLSTSSPSIVTNDYHRNGNHEEPKAILATPPTTSTTTMSSYKQKSIFSPEKESPKTPIKKLKTGKTPPGSSGKKYDTVLNDNMVPPALSPFGSPPPVVTTPSTPSGAKNRNRTSSSSSETELMVVLHKLDDKYLTKDKDNKIKVKEENVVPKEMKTKEIKTEKDENSGQMVNGIETDPTVISNLLKEVVTSPIHHLPVGEVKKEEDLIPKELSQQQVVYDPTTIPQESKKSDHHKSDKKKKKDKHKHKDRNREEKEKKKKHKDKDRDRQKTKESSDTTPPVAPLKITIPKDKITPEGGSGLKIKIPKDRIKTDTISSNTNQIGGLKIKISKDKIVDNSGNESGGAVSGGSGNSGVGNSNRKRDRDNVSDHGAPPTKISKSTSSNSGNYRTSSSDSSRQNGRSSYNNKQQVSLGGEGGQVGGVAVGALQQQAQWSTQVKLAESKYHSKVPGSNKQPPT